MASPTNRGFGSSEPQPGMYGAGSTGTATQAPRTESGQTTTGLMDKAQELAGNIGAKAEDAWDSTREGVRQAASTVASTAQDAVENVTSFMRRYPVMTLCAGFGLGLLVGRMLARGNMSHLFGTGSRYNWWDEEARHERTYGRYNPSNVSP